MDDASFAQRLEQVIRQKKSPVMAGIDPQWEMLPDEIRQTSIAERGETLEAIAEGYRRFCTQAIEAVADLVPIVKFQSAFFEAVGPQGISVLSELNRIAKQHGLLTVFDGKRNDIGSTAAAYAQAYLGSTTVGDSQVRAWGFDAITVNPFLGSEGIEPFLDAATKNKAGVYVLVRTSNPGAGKLQDLTAGRATIYQHLADWVEGWSNQHRGEGKYGPIGAVVGATVPAQLSELRKRMPHVPLLVPGYGAQGGTAKDVAGAFDEQGFGAVVNNSRGILFAHRQKENAGKRYVDAIREATRRMTADLAAHTSAGKL